MAARLGIEVDLIHVELLEEKADVAVGDAGAGQRSLGPGVDEVAAVLLLKLPLPGFDGFGYRLLDGPSRSDSPRRLPLPSSSSSSPSSSPASSRLPSRLPIRFWSALRGGALAGRLLPRPGERGAGLLQLGAELLLGEVLVIILIIRIIIRIIVRRRPAYPCRFGRHDGRSCGTERPSPSSSSSRSSSRSSSTSLSRSSETSRVMLIRVSPFQDGQDLGIGRYRDGRGGPSRRGGWRGA
jgi:hypothetical protein